MTEGRESGGGRGVKTEDMEKKTQTTLCVIFLKIIVVLSFFLFRLTCTFFFKSTAFVHLLPANTAVIITAVISSLGSAAASSSTAAAGPLEG